MSIFTVDCVHLCTFGTFDTLGTFGEVTLLPGSKLTFTAVVLDYNPITLACQADTAKNVSLS